MNGSVKKAQNIIRKWKANIFIMQVVVFKEKPDRESETESIENKANRHRLEEPHTPHGMEQHYKKNNKIIKGYI